MGGHIENTGKVYRHDIGVHIENAVRVHRHDISLVRIQCSNPSKANFVIFASSIN